MLLIGHDTSSGLPRWRELPLCSTPLVVLTLAAPTANLRFGAFGLDGDIFFEHTIVGSTLDKEELKASVLAVSHVADTYDDQLTARWGGIRTIDRMKGSFQS